MGKEILKSHPIDPVIAKLVMVSLGVIFIILGIFITDIIVLFKQQSITNYVVGTILIFTSIIAYIEIGLKRWTDWSKLSKFENQQILSFLVATFIFTGGVLSILSVNSIFGFGITNFMQNDEIMLAGGIIILEALR